MAGGDCHGTLKYWPASGTFFFLFFLEGPSVTCAKQNCFIKLIGLWGNLETRVHSTLNYFYWAKRIQKYNAKREIKYITGSSSMVKLNVVQRRKGTIH